MPFKDKKKRRKWEKQPDQLRANAARQSRHRARLRKKGNLEAIKELSQRSGIPISDLACVSPTIKEQLNEL